MNKIQKLLSSKDKNILSIYFTAGFPKLESTQEVLSALIGNGADLIEIGMPYSDPLADGPVIQNSSMKALKNGMSISTLFRQLRRFREKQTPSNDVPLILMGYLNPVLQYGMETFCRDASEVGISGVILPDLPMKEYKNEYKTTFDKYGLSFIFLITPETSEERIREIDSLTTGFIYAVSSSSVTGGDKDLHEQERYFQKIRNMKLNHNVLIGFGIRDHATFSLASTYTSGAIIGTAYINQIESSTNIESDTASFLNSILRG